ncbi:MAG: AmmeMemoRadiSam system radical SAM enzyme [Proteobacteria bacterium]|nr:AmmeMemoRadiSam system radical SAM enzyme [Pseudomonadota bacterium]MBU2470014.1 AmmeMemoRadiSam system radical SAM enzyme [Pseudomonadota bacterium]MBU2519447.1 AmmeMemoRadiSam system radical SAM enzyme [Pseudomonadota bacterium]
MHEAMLYDKLSGGKARCRLCAHGCLIDPGKRGNCQVRENQDGTLYSLVYGKTISGNVDPIEKKPLFHFLPGTTSYSIATIGCNFQCAFCQNWDISQYTREGGKNIPGGGPGGSEVSPRQIVEAAKRAGCASISYTYTEPTIFFEYAYDCMKLAHEAGLKNVFVTNGYESADCVAACQGLLDAANVDLKAMSEGFYRRECKASLQPVLDTLKRMHQAGIWLEVTTLLIPGKNDAPLELGNLARFIARELSTEVPWHLSAYTPRYKYAEEGGPGRTPVATLEMAMGIGLQAGLAYVYPGNVLGHEDESTKCPGCGEKVVKRRGYAVGGHTLKHGLCPSCAKPIAGVWQ